VAGRARTEMRRGDVLRPGEYCFQEGVPIGGILDRGITVRSIRFGETAGQNACRNAAETLVSQCRTDFVSQYSAAQGSTEM
jgi:hypothetical protein